MNAQVIHCDATVAHGPALLGKVCSFGAEQAKDAQIVERETEMGRDL